jgi:hypothetical protein
MIWTAVWTKSSLARLATMWMNAPNQNTVSLAANSIDETLRRDPYALSESRADNARVMFVPPLGVAFDVSDDDSLVTVWGVWQFD